MKILVPTDLSPLSKVALTYAAKLCVKLNAGMVVMNLIQIDKDSEQSAHTTSARSSEIEKELTQLINEAKIEVGENLKASIVIKKEGPVEEAIDKCAQRLQCDLIVMGTKGASGLRKVLFGSNTAAVINTSPIPVLAVPEFGVFQGINDLVYASDMNNLFKEFSILLPLARVFDAKIHLVHVYQKENQPKVDEESMATKLRKEMNYSRIDCHYILNEDVTDGLERFLSGRSADILAMFSGKRNFFERILGKSNTREIAFRSNTPLLTFNKRTVFPS